MGKVSSSLQENERLIESTNKLKAVAEVEEIKSGE